RDDVLLAAEIDVAVLLLVTAADETRGDPADGIAAAGLRLPFGERLLGLRLRNLIERVMRLKTDAGGSRLVFFDRHSVLCLSPNRELHALDEIGRLFSRHEPHIGLAPVAALALVTAHSLDLAANVEEPDFLDLHFEELFDGLLDLDLVRLGVDLEGEDVVAGFAHHRRFLGDERTADDLIGVHDSSASVRRCSASWLSTT